MAKQRRGPVVLAILDGWGLAEPGPGNAVATADTPVMDRLLATCPNATLLASGEDVGLPGGQMGNSEVGHLNLGAGFVVYQWLTRLDQEVKNGTLGTNLALRDAMGTLIGAVRGVSDTEQNNRLHLIGLVSDGGVHSHIQHLVGLLRMAHQLGLRGADVLIHVITDGRDTPPDSASRYVADLQATIDGLGVGVIATVSGRYYAMDRDNRWERTELAWRAMVRGDGPAAESAVAAVAASQSAGITDEFIEPRVLPVDGRPYGGMRDGDRAIWFNFRSDRARQLVSAMVSPDFDGFDRGDWPRLVVVTLTEYQEGLPVTVAYREADIAHPLASEISRAGLTQYHAAETEKYPHVTYFLNGGREAPFEGETREMVSSPKVATYDLQPEMSAASLTDKVVAAVRDGGFDFVVVNFANGDMVGHTGDFDAVVRAIETVDDCLGRLIDATLGAGGVLLVTADHGNAEEMIDPASGGPLTSHTTNPVPVILVTAHDDPDRHVSLRTDGILSAVAPTVLDLLGLVPPESMTQTSLIQRD